MSTGHRSLPGAPGGHLPHGGWYSWISVYDGVARVALVALPVAALIIGWLAHRRRLSGSTTAHAWLTSLADVGIAYGTMPFVWITLLPGSQAGSDPGRVSLIPLQDLPTMSTFQIVGNLLIFAAVGFIVPLRFAMLASLPRVLALTATGSALIETAQYALRLDRVSSVDDVLLNTAGAGMAALASRGWWRSRRVLPGGTRLALAKGR